MRDEKLRRTIRDLDWDEDTEISVVIQAPPAKHDEPSSWAGLGWRIYNSIPGAPKKVLAVSMAIGAAIASHHYGLW